MAVRLVAKARLAWSQGKGGAVRARESESLFGGL